MSWDAELTTKCCGIQYGGDFGYTYNTTSMVAFAAETIGEEFDGFQRTLDGMDGSEGRKLLRRLSDELHDNAAKYDEMNPENGWGSREGIVAEMRRMADAVPGSPETVWRVT